MIDRVKKNKVLFIVLALALGWVLIKVFGFKAPTGDQYYLRMAERGYEVPIDQPMAEYDAIGGVSMGAPAISKQTAADQSAVVAQNRVVINESSLSMVVKDVRDIGDKIIKYAETNGGFMVNSSYNRPEESPYATIIVRVSSEKLNEAMEFYRNLGVKVVQEKLTGRDVTEEFTDIEARIDTLNKTKVKFEQILEQATEVQDILQVNQQLMYLQDQIDHWQGQKESIEQNANLTKITVYLSTDELALPYVPDEKFRPNVIFKLAVRSLVSSARGIAGWGIWLAVYSVIWIPIVVIYYLFRKYRKTSKNI